MRQSQARGPKTGPKRTVRTRKIIDEIEDGDDTEEESTEETGEGVEIPADPLEDALTEIRGHTGMRLNVYKRDAKSNARGFCCDVEPDDAGGYDVAELMKRLQGDFGGGEYEMWVRDPRGAMVRRIRFTVLAPNRTTAVMAGAASEDRLASAIAAALAPMQQALAAVTQRPAFDLNSILGNMQPVLAAALQLKALFGSGQPQPAEFDLEKFLNFKQKLDLLGLGEHEPSGIQQALMLFREMGQPLIEAMKANANRGGPAMLPATGAPTAPGANGAGGTAAPSPFIRQLNALLPMIAQMGKQGLVPEDAAVRIAAVIPDEAVDDLCDAIENGTLPKLLKAHPAFASIGEWVDKTAAAILAQYTDPDGQSGDDPQEGGPGVPSRGGGSADSSADA